MLILGEVRTCLLHNSGPLPRNATTELLGLLSGQQVLFTERPIGRAVSPEMAVGVDCRLAAEPRAKARAVGTVISRASITGGLVLQGSAMTRVHRTASNHRLAWSHYMARPGVVEVIGKVPATALASGYLADEFPVSTLDLGSVSEHVIASVQRRPQLDHVTVIRARPTRVRWAAVVRDADAPTAKVAVTGETVRTVSLEVREDQLGLVAQFCEDFALHDWLLTTLGQVVERAERGGFAGQEPIDILGSAVERLLHLWMPGAHVDPVMCTIWDALDRRPGLTRQWNARVSWIRDQIALKTLQALEVSRRGSAEW